MKKNTKTLRVLIPLAIILLVAIGFGIHSGFGTLSDFGWNEISIICPLGALTTMLASKMVVPRAIISLVIVIVLIILFGRTFCGWVCPVPVVSKLRTLFSRKKPETKIKPADELTADEKKALKASCGSGEGCDSCREKAAKFDSRHWVLGGSILSAAIFGFPVFCLVCPIGLTFATILLVMRAFGGGDVTWSLVLVPLLLLCEVVFFRKWCSRFCPLSALMSLVGFANRTFRPSIDDSKCLETAHGRSCGVCGTVCPEGIDPRHPQLGAYDMNECTRCRECIDHCPGDAISMPLLAKSGGGTASKGAPAKAASAETTTKAG